METNNPCIDNRESANKAITTKSKKCKKELKCIELRFTMRALHLEVWQKDKADREPNYVSLA